MCCTQASKPLHPPLFTSLDRLGAGCLAALAPLGALQSLQMNDNPVAKEADYCKTCLVRPINNWTQHLSLSWTFGQRMICQISRKAGHLLYNHRQASRLLANLG